MQSQVSSVGILSSNEEVNEDQKSFQVHKLRFERKTPNYQGGVSRFGSDRSGDSIEQPRLS